MVLAGEHCCWPPLSFNVCPLMTSFSCDEPPARGSDDPYRLIAPPPPHPHLSRGITLITVYAAWWAGLFVALGVGGEGATAGKPPLALICL